MCNVYTQIINQTLFYLIKLSFKDLQHKTSINGQTPEELYDYIFQYVLYMMLHIDNKKKNHLEVGIRYAEVPYSRFIEFRLISFCLFDFS